MASQQKSVKKTKPVTQTGIKTNSGSTRGFLACFPTHVYISGLESSARARSARAKVQRSSTTAFCRELLEQCYLVRDTDDDGVRWSSESYIGGYTSYGSITDLHKRYPHFAELEAKLSPHVRRFARRLEWDLQGGSLRMTDCWINIMGYRTPHSLHLHPLSVLSGTYYVRVPRLASQIQFEDPRLDRFMAAPPRLANAGFQNQTILKCQAKSGEVALWESWLRHEVPPNAAEEDRVSISFNYDWI